ncbi:hypothetical protein [Ktedonobacter racemifer]|uniref:hypothetical protein n=1 Tax=Ktedonobacter racemifer TaxID=363277 RepID=UPI0005913156|nr:hypothetical protein [Ktedonobacter racemifer]
MQSHIYSSANTKSTYARPLPFPTSERRPLPAHTYEKQQRARLYYAHTDGLTEIELAGLLQVSPMTTNRYRQHLQAINVQPRALPAWFLVPRR